MTRARAVALASATLILLPRMTVTRAPGRRL
jgi:hypothetical protein